MNDISCSHDPREVHGAIGMYHCPECGEMQLAGHPHLAPWSAEDDEEYQRYLKESMNKNNKEFLDWLEEIKFLLPPAMSVSEARELYERKIQEEKDFDLKEFM